MLQESQFTHSDPCRRGNANSTPGRGKAIAMTATLRTCLVILSLGLPPLVAAQPTVELVWSATTGTGSPGTDTIRAAAGDELTLDVRVTDGGTCHGLLGAFLSLYWDPGRLTGFGAEECPAPPNATPGICLDSADNAFVPFFPGVTEAPGLAEDIDAAAVATPAPGFLCGEVMTLARTRFIVEIAGDTEVVVGYQQAVDGILDGQPTVQFPPATAFVQPPGCG